MTPGIDRPNAKYELPLLAPTQAPSIAEADSGIVKKGHTSGFALEK